MEPEMAKTLWPCSAAKRAVISEPLRFATSTTSAPGLSTLIKRLRRGKLSGFGATPIWNSEMIAPRAAMRYAKRRCRMG